METGSRIEGHGRYTGNWKQEGHMGGTGNWKQEGHMGGTSDETYFL